MEFKVKRHKYSPNRVHETSSYKYLYICIYMYVNFICFLTFRFGIYCEVCCFDYFGLHPPRSGRYFGSTGTVSGCGLGFPGHYSLCCLGRASEDAVGLRLLFSLMDVADLFFFGKVCFPAISRALIVFCLVRGAADGFFSQISISRWQTNWTPRTTTKEIAKS